MKCLVFLSLFLLSHAAGDWVQVGLPHPQHTVRVTFAIKQTNPEWLAEKLRAVSYPDSAHYGEYMNFDDIAEYVHGKPESVSALMQSLEAVGVPSSTVDFTLGGDFAVAWLPVQSAELLFSNTFYEFESMECGRKVITSHSYTLPASLEEHLDFVSGVSGLPEPCTKRNMTSTRPMGVQVTPETIATDYNTSKYVATNGNTSQAVGAFLRQYYDPSDLEIFQKRYNIPNKPIAKVVGKNEPDDPGVEANLDVQYISATGRGVSTWFISISTYSNGRQEDFLSYITSQVNNTASPWVHSASYGDIENSIEDSYLDRMDNEFMKFGISGRTFLFATGDDGVYCKRKGIRKVYTPNWPASSPYVTAVGGTEGAKRVWSSGGGGFSNYFGMPDYQKEAVSKYLEKYPDHSKFNSSGRAYPDVSAFATDFVIINDGFPEPVDGTSCSAPTFAGVVAILNDVRLNSGGKTLGFLNPLLYQTLKGKGFNDITEGENGGLACEGFAADVGWDPASGWGSPNFGLLKGMI
jgi:tripeptidyl-peptidase-1